MLKINRGDGGDYKHFIFLNYNLKLGIKYSYRNTLYYHRSNFQYNKTNYNINIINTYKIYVRVWVP